MELMDAFENALETKQADTIQQLLDQGLDPNIRIHFRDKKLRVGTIPLLLWALNQGHFALFESLLKRGANPLAKTEFQEPLIFDDEKPHACIDLIVYSYQRADLLAMVIEQAPTSSECLLGAVKLNSIPLVKILLGNGTNPNTLQNGHISALNTSAQLQNNEMMSLLLEAGADPDTKDLFGKSLLDKAVYCRDFKYIRLFFPYIKELKKAFSIALSYLEDLEFIKKHLHQDLLFDDLSTKDQYQLFRLAISKNDLALTQYCLDKGLKPNHENHFSNDALMICRDHEGDEDYRVLITLLEWGVNPDSYNKNDGLTALILALLKNDTAFVQHLMAAGANPQFHLRLAMELDFKNEFIALLELGASIDLLKQEALTTEQRSWLDHVLAEIPSISLKH